MVNLLKTSGRVAGTLLAAALLLPAQGHNARPGTVNFTEGMVSVNGQAVSEKQLGSVRVAPGQTLETRDGRAEMLLTPGVFLRLGNQSAVKMVSASIIDTRVEVLRGTAMLEADQVEKENHLAVLNHGSTTAIVKQGVYAFNADQPKVMVYDGHAKVQQDDRTADLFKGDQVTLSPDNPKLKVKGFHVKSTEQADSLYAWSKLRSEYSAETNMSLAQTVAGTNPNWYAGTGWYWDPYFDSFGFMPGDGYLFSPFGWGFMSPAFWGGYYAPYYGYGYGFGRGGYGYGRYPIGRGRPPVMTRGSVGGAVGARSFGGGFGGGMRMGGGGMRMGGGGVRMGGGGGMRGGGGGRR
jgi:lipopolysaccharide export system protein LptA